jgi:hypothetical protein
MLYSLLLNQLHEIDQIIDDLNIKICKFVFEIWEITPLKKNILTLFIAVSVSNLQLPILKLQNVPKKTKILIFWLEKQPVLAHYIHFFLKEIVNKTCCLRAI